jgi:hypothetical protein
MLAAGWVVEGVMEGCAQVQLAGCVPAVAVAAAALICRRLLLHLQLGKVKASCLRPPLTPTQATEGQLLPLLFGYVFELSPLEGVLVPCHLQVRWIDSGSCLDQGGPEPKFAQVLVW